MKVILTGATGFIGSHLLKACLLQGWTVHVIARKASKENTEHPRYFCHLFGGSTQELIKILRSEKPDLVLHLASQFVAEHKTEDIEPLIQSNLFFGTQLLEAMSTAGIKRLINTGTSWQHFSNEDYNPVSLYAATKQAFEDIAKFFSASGKISIIHLKLFDTYGPNDQRKKIFSTLISICQKVIAEESLDLLYLSEGEQLINIVHVDDVISAYLQAAKYIITDKHFDSVCYGVASENLYSLKEIVHQIEQIANVKLPVVFGKRPYREREVMIPWSKFKLLPEWKQTITIEQGIINFLKK